MEDLSGKKVILGASLSRNITNKDIGGVYTPPFLQIDSEHGVINDKPFCLTALLKVCIINISNIIELFYH